MARLSGMVVNLCLQKCFGLGFLFGGGGIVRCVMKPRLLTILLVLAAAVFCAPLESQAQTNLTNGSWNSTISPAAGGTKTSISFFATGDWATNGWISTLNHPAVSSVGIGYSGFFAAPPGAWSFGYTNYLVSPYGYYTNHTKSTSIVLERINFNNPGPLQVLVLSATNAFAYDAGDLLQLVFDSATTVLEVDLVFSNFNPGSYNGVDSSSGTQFNMEIVPEPSTYALLALSAAGLGGYFLRRRRR